MFLFDISGSSSVCMHEANHYLLLLRFYTIMEILSIDFLKIIICDCLDYFFWFIKQTI